MATEQYFACDTCGRRGFGVDAREAGVAFVVGTGDARYMCLPGHGCKSGRGHGQWCEHDSELESILHQNDDIPARKGVTQEQVDDVFESLYAYIDGYFSGTRPAVSAERFSENFARFARALRGSLE